MLGASLEPDTRMAAASSESNGGIVWHLTLSARYANGQARSPGRRAVERVHVVPNWVVGGSRFLAEREGFGWPGSAQPLCTAAGSGRRATVSPGFSCWRALAVMAARGTMTARVGAEQLDNVTGRERQIHRCAGGCWCDRSR